VIKFTKFRKKEAFMGKEDKNLKKTKNKLFFEKSNIWYNLNKVEYNKVFTFTEEYKNFISSCKTEREVVKNINNILISNNYTSLNKAKTSDKKIFYNYKNIALASLKINNNDFSKGFKIIATHIDTPRLDLKSNNLFEAEDMVYVKTHYYGGIKKYQWLSRPLAIHGEVILENQNKVNIVIGENDDEPVFTINDLLPHLAQDQLSKTASKFIEAEQLNVLIGSIPYKLRKGSKAFKLNVLNILKEKYNINEQDIYSSNLQFVPQGKARDVGLDKSFIGAYGQDNRVSTYLALKALLNTRSKDNLLVLFFDKEEIGSCNASGADSNIVLRVLAPLFDLYNSKVSLYKALENSYAISADVTAGIDPEWKSVSDSLNDAKLGYGVSIIKAGGVRGKSSSSEPSIEFLAALRHLFNSNKIKWYPSEMGKLDLGGGGTVAKFLSYYGIDVVDCAIPLLSMHAPFEISSKVDIYEFYKALKLFFDAF